MIIFMITLSYFFKFKLFAYCHFFSLGMFLLSSCCSSLNEEPPFDNPSEIEFSYASQNSPNSATILILHKDPEYGRNINYKDKISVTWKAFPNSEENVDIYLNKEGMLDNNSGNEATNFTVSYDDIDNIASIQPWPYMGDECIKLVGNEKTNVLTTLFEGDTYYMFNPVMIDLPANSPELVNRMNGRPIKYITLLCDYVSFGSHLINTTEAEDDCFYLYANLPLPHESLKRDAVYIYILEDDYNFFENGRRAGNDSLEAVSVYTASHPNDPDKYKLYEYSPATNISTQIH